MKMGIAKLIQIFRKLNYCNLYCNNDLIFKEVNQQLQLSKRKSFKENNTSLSFIKVKESNDKAII